MKGVIRFSHAPHHTSLQSFKQQYIHSSLNAKLDLHDLKQQSIYQNAE